MQVKNIARNLFLSGALVLSGSTVYNKPSFAFDEKDFSGRFLRAKYLCDQKHRGIVEHYKTCISPVAEWISNLKSCMEKSKTGFDNECPVCMDDVLQSADSLIEYLESVE